MSDCKMRPLLLILVSLVCLEPASGQNPDSLTLDQAVRMTVSSHPAVRQTEQAVIAARARIEQSCSSLYPDVKAEALYSRIGPLPEMSLAGGNTFELAPADNFNFHVNLREVLYDFGRRSTGEKMERTGGDAAEIRVEMTRSNLAYRTVEIFYAILFLRQNIVVLDEQIEALNQHLLITQKRFQTGSATDFDVLTTNVRISAIQTKKIDAANSLQKQENNFRQLTGLSQGIPIYLKGDFVIEAISLNADSLFGVACSQFPELKASVLAENSADIRLQLTTLGMKPVLNLMLDAGLKNGYPDNLNVLRANWVGGLQLSAPLFNGFLTRYQKQEAQANLEAAQQHTRDLERQILTNVNQSIADIQANQEKITTLQPQIEQARQAVLQAQARYDAGVSTNLDLLDAQTVLAEAELNQVRAKYELKMSYYNLEKVVGQEIW